MHTQRQIDQLQAQRAAEWIEALKDGHRHDRESFVEWLHKSSVHVETYLDMECLDVQIRSLDAAAGPDIEALLKRAGANVIRLERAAVDEPHRRSLRLGWAAAAILAVMALTLALGTMGYGVLSGTSSLYTTAVGEQRTLTLADGSIVRMNVETTLRIHYNGRERDIELTAGEAAFEVAHDAARPFIVHTAGTAVRAVGTQFNVYHRTAATVVSVLEGRVQVSTVPAVSSNPAPTVESVAAGEEARVVDGHIQKHDRPDVQNVASWFEGRLFFDEMPLEEIVREFNRHGGPVRLTTEGVPPGSHRFGGTFNANDPSALADVLEAQGDLEVERRPGEIVIRPRSAGAAHH